VISKHFSWQAQLTTANSAQTLTIIIILCVAADRAATGNKLRQLHWHSYGSHCKNTQTPAVFWVG